MVKCNDSIGLQCPCAAQGTYTIVSTNIDYINTNIIIDDDYNNTNQSAAEAVATKQSLQITTTTAGNNNSDDKDNDTFLQLSTLEIILLCLVIFLISIIVCCGVLLYKNIGNKSHLNKKNMNHLSTQNNTKLVMVRSITPGNEPEDDHDAQNGYLSDVSLDKERNGSVQIEGMRKKTRVGDEKKGHCNVNSGKENGVSRSSIVTGAKYEDISVNLAKQIQSEEHHLENNDTGATEAEMNTTLGSNLIDSLAVQDAVMNEIVDDIASDNEPMS